jgi:hypothetical protein
VGKVRVLDFDLENRPLSYLGQDYTTAEITAIAACWDGEPSTMQCWLLGKHDPRVMLECFRTMYDRADMVTGHYIRKHDLPIINGAMLECGLPCLAEKLTCDTKLDLVRKGPVISASQENLAELFNLPAPKVHMNTAKWRVANRLTPAGLKLTEQRAVGDVVQHMALRRALVARDLLGPPMTWRP